MIPNQNDELTKQIIELSKKHEEMKIEKLLEERLRKDPENIDLLFRLAILNIWVPFVDYATCWVFFERIIWISTKYRTIAELIISTRNNENLGFMLKNVIYWFYSGKDPELINNITKHLIEQIYNNGIFIDVSDAARSFFNDELKKNPNNIEALLILTIIEISPERKFNDKSVKLLERIIEISKEIEAVALILYAYIKNFCQIDEALLERLKKIHTDNAEINSMIKYVISFAYAYNETNDISLEEKYLKESIELYQGHVWNYVHLARLYNKQNKSNDAELLMKKARSNIKKLYQKKSDFENYDPTSLTEQLNALIKGIYSTGIDN